jgi:hypothetical protein
MSNKVDVLIGDLEGVTEGQVSVFDILRVGNTLFYNEAFMTKVVNEYIKNGGQESDALKRILASSDPANRKNQQ